MNDVELVRGFPGKGADGQALKDNNLGSGRRTGGQMLILGMG